MNSQNATAISQSLPLQLNEFYGAQAHTFFSGLLPEEEELRQIARSIGTDSTNSFRLLLEIGKECIGAIQIGEKDENEKPDYEKIIPKEWKIVLKKNETRAAYLVKEKKQRLSLAGAQSKMGVLYKNNNYYFATKGAAGLLSFRIGNEVFPFEQFDLKYNRPDIILNDISPYRLFSK